MSRVYCYSHPRLSRPTGPKIDGSLAAFSIAVVTYAPVQSGTHIKYWRKLRETLPDSAGDSLPRQRGRHRLRIGDGLAPVTTETAPPIQLLSIQYIRFQCQRL